ncbi:MAG TPA: BCD family MFS transporter [Burkholderiaceae bacterium]|nr:BCD family MFS transporter [Burkholderiaceae bacterium]
MAIERPAMRALVRVWTRIGPRFLPFADAASAELPLARLLRLSLFQVSVGLAAALLIGTLNRVMIVELGVAAWLVALMVALPLVAAPFRALIGFRSDVYRSVLGWRRVPFIWLGTMLQFGGLAIMPFALILLSGDGRGPAWVGHAGAALAFLLVGAGMQTTQTAGLALAADIAPAGRLPRVVALLYVMLLVGMIGAGAVFAVCLMDFSAKRLIQVVQAAAIATMGLNIVALWKQEARRPAAEGDLAPSGGFRAAWREFTQRDRSRRFLVAVSLGALGFSMQDVILEPYGGQVLRLPVGVTTGLTALLAIGAFAGLATSARALAQRVEPCRLAGYGALVGVAAFAIVIFAAPLASTWLFACGIALVGLGGGLFGMGTLAAAMQIDSRGLSGMTLGAWGAVQATAAGAGIALGGGLRDLFSGLAHSGALGIALDGAATGYALVYLLEIGLLFATLVAIGPLALTAPGAARGAAVPAAGFGPMPEAGAG